MVTELIGPRLDEAVALALGLHPVVECHMTQVPRPIACWLIEPGARMPDIRKPPFSPSTDWSQGGPIIERERIELTCGDDGSWWGERHIYSDGRIAFRTSYDKAIVAKGHTPLIAAMRAFVASKT